MIEVLLKKNSRRSIKVEEANNHNTEQPKDQVLHQTDISYSVQNNYFHTQVTLQRGLYLSRGKVELNYFFHYPAQQQKTQFKVQ